MELSEDDEIDLDEMNKKNFLNSTRKTVRYEKPKATMAITKQHMRSEQNGSSSIVGMYHTHADTLQPHHHHQHASHTQNQVNFNFFTHTNTLKQTMSECL